MNEPVTVNSEFFALNCTYNTSKNRHKQKQVLKLHVMQLSRIFCDLQDQRWKEMTKKEEEEGKKSPLVDLKGTKFVNGRKLVTNQRKEKSIKM